MKRMIVILLVSLIASVIMNGCTTVRKCNGQPGTRVPMGIM